MSYTVQTWTDNVTRVDAEHLNHMEQGIADGQPHGDVFYGTCSTAYGTTTKAVTCEGFELFVGAQVLVEFSNYSTATSPSLNVNLTGAKNIYVNGDVATSGNRFAWGAGAKIPFVYDGTGYVPMGHTDSFVGECVTSASTAQKTASVDGFVLAKGVSVTLLMTYANTNASPTLQVSSSGTCTIKGNTDWKAGDYVTFVFDGTYYIGMGVNLDDLTAAVETAQSTADAAQSAASAAQTTANNAASAASAAQSTADSAVTTAQTAQSTAESALSAAQTAQTALEDISATLSQMQAQIDDLDERVSALEAEVFVPVYANYFAVYSADDSSLTFYGDDTLPTAGTQYNGKTATDIYTGVENTGTSNPPWYDQYQTPTKVTFDKSFSGCRPKSCYAWFMDWYHNGTPDLRYLNTSECTTMYSMFYYWNRWSYGAILTSLDVSGFNTGKVTDMSYMFLGLQTIISLDVSKFDTSQVTNMSSMFYCCYALTSLDVSKFDTSQVTNMSYMFAYCSELTTIYSDDTNFVTTKVTSSSNRNYMFTNCSKLVGGNGTVYSSSKVTADMAHVDTASNPGYFTAK